MLFKMQNIFSDRWISYGKIKTHLCHLLMILMITMITMMAHMHRHPLHVAVFGFFQYGNKYQTVIS